MKTILSAKKMKVRAATLAISLERAGDQVGLRNGYIYRLGGKNTMTLSTLDRIANALQCSVCDLLEEVTEDETEGQTSA